jgi:hypothetical protein
MKLLNIKTAIVTTSFGLIALFGTGEINAQSRNQNDRFPNQSINQQKIELEKQRQYEEQVRLERERQEQMRVKYERNRKPWEKNVRYKVFQNGKMFITDSRGLEMLKQAVIRGYEEGFKSGLSDRKNRKKGGFNNSMMYRNASFGYQNSVELKQYQFFFQKGFSEGYEDGFNTRRFRGWYQNDGKLSERELQAILKYERF